MKQTITTLLIFLSAFCATADNTVTISMITTAQGRQIYELEGHAAMRITVGDSIDYVINWGLFDFSAPNFVGRFVSGETDYMCGAVPTDYFLYCYKKEGRTVYEQKLDIPQDVARKILDLVNKNLTPPNNVYRYNYIKNNCATQPMAIIEKALGQKLMYQDYMPEISTYRQAMGYYHRNYPWYQFGIDIALGCGIDHQISPREKVFAPTMLTHLLSSATYTFDGKQKKIVSTTVIYGDENADITCSPTPWRQSPMCVAIVILILAAIVTVYDLRRKVVSLWMDTVIYVPVILCSLLLTFLIFKSTHEATSPNFNYLWLSPVSIAILPLMWINKSKMLAVSPILLNFVCLIAYLIVISIGIQTANPAFIPIVIALLLRSYTYLYIARWQRKNKN